MLHDYLHLLNYQMMEQELSTKINEARSIKTQLEMEKNWSVFIEDRRIGNERLKRKTA